MDVLQYCNHIMCFLHNNTVQYNSYGNIMTSGSIGFCDTSSKNPLNCTSVELTENGLGKHIFSIMCSFGSDYCTMRLSFTPRMKSIEQNIIDMGQYGPSGTSTEVQYIDAVLDCVDVENKNYLMHYVVGSDEYRIGMNTYKLGLEDDEFNNTLKGYAEHLGFFTALKAKEHTAMLDKMNYIPIDCRIH